MNTRKRLEVYERQYMQRKYYMHFSIIVHNAVHEVRRVSMFWGQMSLFMNAGHSRIWWRAWKFVN